MRKIAGVATALTLTVCATAVFADDFPARKPGLWVLTLQAGGKVSTTMKMCIDPDTDPLLRKFGSALRSATCAKNDVKVNGDTAISDSECKIGSTTVTTEAVTKFTGDTYHTDVKSHFDPALLGKTDTTASQDGKWTGDCPADMKPGDLILANGIKVNVKTLNAFKSLLGK